jgi:hypothetical protein
MRGFYGKIMLPIIRKNKPQINADERRFIESVVSLPDHIVSPYALCAAVRMHRAWGKRGEGAGVNIRRFILILTSPAVVYFSGFII